MCIYINVLIICTGVCIIISQYGGSHASEVALCLNGRLRGITNLVLLCVNANLPNKRSSFFSL